jgi:RNA polymerase sigma-32 factor
MASLKGAAIAKDGDGLRRYLQQMQKLPMLGAQEELELRKDQDDNVAKQLVACHLRLVAKIAFRYRGYGLPLGDLISEGNIGMMHAVRKFDPEFRFRLASYARWWVRAAHGLIKGERIAYFPGRNREELPRASTRLGCVLRRETSDGRAECS